MTTNKQRKQSDRKKNTENPFSGAASILGAGIDALFTDTGPQYSMVPVDMIEIKTQIREVFEDDENTLEDLAESIKVRGVLQPILLRSSESGYELIAGERRYRASILAGFEQIPAYIREMTDEEADDAQLAENIHRKNLTQIEEAKKIQRDLDLLGSTDAVLKKHQKSRPWLSKMLSLLNLPEQAKRLVVENVSADVEVINTVKVIEKHDPIKAKNLVDDLKKTRGKENARSKAANIKEQVKPSKRQKKIIINDETKLDKQKNKKQSNIFAGAKFVHNESSALVLNNVYMRLFENDESPISILDDMSKEDRNSAETFLYSFCLAGKTSKDAGRALIMGFREGQFSNYGAGALALVAFIKGLEQGEFSLLNVFSCVSES